MPKIAQIAGPCLDAKQCQTCAKNIVLFYIKLQEQIQQEKENREKQRQKSLMDKEVNAQKQKQQEKKAKKKQKQNTNVEEEKISNKSINGTVVAEEKKKKELSKPVKKRWFLKLFFYSVTLVVLLSVVLFIATSLDLSFTKNIAQYVTYIWKISVQNLPAEYQTIAAQTENYFIHVHNITGREFIKFFDTFFKR